MSSAVYHAAYTFLACAQRMRRGIKFSKNAAGEWRLVVSLRGESGYVSAMRPPRVNNHARFPLLEVVLAI
ncbi:hypothetical protein KCP73_17420 [Salmonella enterica subsp. enterica]|nr:hypothetical protein KCP73_17420 [Salmonella enterica subsp. enterica]